MDNSNPLKIKLKLGNRSNSPSVPPYRDGESDDEPQESLNLQNQQDSPISEPYGEGGEVADDDASRERHKKSKKKKKKKEKDRSKHKHKHSKDKPETTDEPPAKRLHADSAEVETTVFKEYLNHLLDILQKKDSQQFFQFPVTDDIAPGYSAIIKEPMDFSQMKQKVDGNQYENIESFKDDFQLICNNCSKYNHEGTIYHKAAKKLLHSGQKLFSPDRLVQLGNDIPNFFQISSDKMGFEISSVLALNDTDGSGVPKFSDNDGNSDSASCSGELAPSVVLQEAQAAAKEAAEKLTLKKPSSTLGFLRQKNDGTTSLNFLTGCEGSSWPNKEKTVSLGLLAGKPAQGTASLTNCKEDKRSMAKPVRPVFYGAFSSFCPSYDSTFSNLSREESEMIYSTYGNETAVQYAECICDFSRDCDMAMHLVDQLLNLLTHEQHSRTKNIIEERKRTQQPTPTRKLESQESKSSAPAPYSFDSLRKLSDHGIDMSFLKTFEEIEQQETSIGNKLTNTATLISSFAKEQHTRLSSPLPANLHNLPPPGPAEVKLAEKVSESLVAVAKEVPPGSLAPVPIVRRALGITVSPVKSESQVQVDVESCQMDT